jgi:hypothetical protein
MKHVIKDYSNFQADHNDVEEDQNEENSHIPVIAENPRPMSENIISFYKDLSMIGIGSGIGLVCGALIKLDAYKSSSKMVIMTIPAFCLGAQFGIMRPNPYYRLKEINNYINLKMVIGGIITTLYIVIMLEKKGMY